MIILEKIGSELSAGTGERVKIIEVEIVRQRFDDATDRQQGVLSGCEECNNV